MKKIILILLIFFLYSCQNDVDLEKNISPHIYENKITGIKEIKGNLDNLNTFNCYSCQCSYRGEDIKSCDNILREFIIDINGKEFYGNNIYDYNCEKNGKVIYRFYLDGNLDKVFKNNTLLFDYSSEAIENNRIRNVLEVDKKLIFETYRKEGEKVFKDIYFKDGFLTEKFNLNSAFNIFKYNGRYGFIGEKNGEYKIYNEDGKINFN